jgi:hypothetical protein
LLAQKSKVSISVTVPDKSPPPSQETPPKNATASDLSLNNSEESNSHKLNRVRSSIKAVSNAIVDYVNESKPLDDGTNGRISPRRGLVWLESSFVGTKPIDSPETPDTPCVVIPTSRRMDGSFRNTPAVFSYDGQRDINTTLANNKMVGIQSKKENYGRDEGDGRSNMSSDLSPSNSTHTTQYISRNGEFLMT